MSQVTTAKIGIIVCSQRFRRAGLQIANFVLDTVQKANPSANLFLIGLASWNLPMCDEPGIPVEITDSSGFKHGHTKLWSKEISSHSAFVVVTPQYNWSFPASIKNALDYLYHEWKGKPAMIVSYGGHGGGAAAVQLNQVLLGVRMRPIESKIALSFPTKDYQGQAARGENLKLDAEDEFGIWSSQQKDLIKAFGDLLHSLDG
jgi:NAD(P)H-dependent FMN reductase